MWKLTLLLVSVLVALPGFAAPDTEDAANESLYVFDMNSALEAIPDSANRYDLLKFVSSLQGLVNREEPRLLMHFLRAEGQKGSIDLDLYWQGMLTNTLLKGRETVTLKTLDSLLEAFEGDIKGLVIWDPDVPATANVAATVCGVEGLLPVRGGSNLLKKLTSEPYGFKILTDFVDAFDGSNSGSAKCDAYLWAKERYLDQGRCSGQWLGYYVDAFTQRPQEEGVVYPDLPNTTLSNHDFLIAKRAFFFDLSPWGDEKPVDDPGQPLGTDRETFKAILASQAKISGSKWFTTVCGFIPWNQKYTNHEGVGGKHKPVPTEWEFASMLSAYNCIMDADALGLGAMTNASAYMHYPLKSTYEQNEIPEPAPLEEKTYVLVYMGDYDSAAWLTRMIPKVWQDPARGEIPIAWAFNPNLSMRVPFVFDHVFDTKSQNDWFIGGDSGAGYLNPNLLIGDRLGSGLPDALQLWTSHNKSFYDKFDYSITGFVINGFHGDMPLRVQEAYAEFSPDGVGMQLGFAEPLVNDTPFIRHVSDIYPKLNNLEATADQMAGFAKGGMPEFLVFRWILQTPSTLVTVRDLMQEKYPEKNFSFVDPYTFFDLYERHLSGETP